MANEVGALGERIKGGGERIREGGCKGGGGWESGDDCEENGEGECESELSGLLIWI